MPDTADSERGEDDSEPIELAPAAQVQALESEDHVRLSETRAVTLTPQLYTARFPALASNLFLKTFLFNSLHFELDLEKDHSSYEMQPLKIAALESDEHGDQESTSADATATLVIASSKSVGAALTAGFVAWVLRAGALVSAAVSALPVWRGFDPLPILPDDNPYGSSPDDDDLDLTYGIDELFPDDPKAKNE